MKNSTEIATNIHFLMNILRWPYGNRMDCIWPVIHHTGGSLNLLTFRMLCFMVRLGCVAGIRITLNIFVAFTHNHHHQ